MKKHVVENKMLGEKIHICEFDNGLKAFVLPKKGYAKKYATYATHYGSIDNEFIIPEEENITRVPDGIAHFLEHKLFEQEDGPVMEKFSALGASSNAYTSFDHTAYLFSCTENFEESFDLLNKFVQSPFLTEESVEKEKGIIGQEIRMYDDNPNWRVFFNYLEALYEKHPVRIDIAGSVESISGINKDILYKCYNTFYHPSNMMMLVIGEVEPERIFESIEKGQKVKSSRPEIKRIFPTEPKKINNKNAEQKMEVAAPLFILGFKEDMANMGSDYAKYCSAMSIILEMIFGKGSSLYGYMYEKGLINSSFDGDYTFEGSYAYSSIGGESRSPENVRDMILQEVSRIKSNGFDKQAYDRIRKMKLGSAVKLYNSVEKIAHQFVANYMKGISFFDVVEAYDRISFDDINSIFNKHFADDRIALSIIRPM